MEAMEAILQRRSIRRYTTETVPEETVRELLRAAMSAPSAGNEQPWHFIVVDDRTILNEIPKIHPYAQMLRTAPLAIVVCGDLQKEGYPGFWPQDCAAATENLLLAATAHGLGVVWVGVHPLKEREQGLQKLLHLPEHIIPFAIVPIGHPAEHLPPASRFDQSRIHRNTWTQA